MSTRHQKESMLLGAVAGASVSFVLVLVLSLVPWSGSDPTEAAASPNTDTATTETTTAQGNGQGQGQGNGNGQGQGQGNGNGQGQGQGQDSDANADPLSFGLASAEVQDAFANGGCVACHSIKGVGGGAATIGPHLFRLGALAADRRPGSSVEAYIEESIVDPGAFIMPNCPMGPCLEGIMPTTYGESLAAADLATIVGYLSQLGTATEADVLTP